MPRKTKKETESANSIYQNPATGEKEEVMDMLNSKQEIADSLNMSLHQFSQLERKYPFELSGVPGKIMGRWKVLRSDALRWFRYVQRQELRHPESKRLRPEEPPEIAAIRTR